MPESTSNTSTFVLPAAITKVTRSWVDKSIRREVSAAEANASFLASLVADYPQDLSAAHKSKMSGAVKTLVETRTVNGIAAPSNVKSMASKSVTLAWLTVGLTRNGVKVADLPTVKVGDNQRDGLYVVVNGEGGADLKPFRNAVMDAAKAGKWDTIPAIFANVPVPATSPATDKDAAKDDNGTSEPVNVAADLSARNLVNLVGALAKAVRDSALDYSAADNAAILDALADFEASVHSRTVAVEVTSAA